MSNGIEPKITFIDQASPVEEYGRALYAVARSVLRALIDSISDEDLTDVNTPLDKITLRQLAKLARLPRDKGMRGDGFEWAVHEAIIGREPRVLKIIAEALEKTSPKIRDADPISIMYGQERARYLGFLDAVVQEAGEEAFLLPDGRGRPFNFGPWVATAAGGKTSEPLLKPRIKSVWKTDVFLSSVDNPRHLAATVKSNFEHLEGGPGLRIGIVPESSAGNPAGVRWNPKHQLWAPRYLILMDLWVSSMMLTGLWRARFSNLESMTPVTTSASRAPRLNVFKLNWRGMAMQRF